MDKNLKNGKISDEYILSLINKEKTRERGYSLLVNKFKEKMYWYIIKMVDNHDDANDVMQNVFIRVWKNIRMFRGESLLYTWIYRIATNETISFLKHKKKKQSISFDTTVHDRTTHQEHTSPNLIERKLKMAVEKLPPKQKKVFLLKYYGDVTYETMGRILKTKENTLKATYFIAAKKIEGDLKKQGV